MVFLWSLSDTKSPQVSMTFLSILADLNNAEVWMASPHPLISMSSSTSTNPLATLPSAPITIGIAITFLLHRFFQFPKKVRVLMSLRTFLHLYPVISRNSKTLNLAGSLFYVISY